MMRSFISIEELADKPYAGIIGYPKATKRQLDARVRELERLQIKAVSLSGSTMLGNLAVLGKGYAGVVVLARRDGGTGGFEDQKDGLSKKQHEGRGRTAGTG